VRGAQEYLAGLAQLHRMSTAEERRGLWRQGLATLAAAAIERRPVPLEGLSPEDLLASVRVALETRLVDDLGWLSPPAAAAAVFELATALPPSPEKRELGRRVLHDLQEGDAATFVALATSLALATRRGLAGEPLRARVALCLQLPIGAGVPVEPLALALLSRRDLEREWLSVPSMGSLPSRRLAARVLERAAREAARLAAAGDDGGVRIFEQPPVRAAWQRLLADRESLVWRHVATARGLLSRAIGSFREEIHHGLSPTLGPTEWRRAGASLAASLAIDPEGALRKSLEVLAGDIPKRDGGVPATMIFGLPRAAEAEPETAEDLLATLVREGGIDAAEALVDLRAERVGAGFGAMVAASARQELGAQRALDHDPDDGRVALLDALVTDLDDDEERTPTLRDRVARALDLFAERGPRAAREAVDEAIFAAQTAMAWLERAQETRPEERRRAFRALRELDLAMLETSTLADLAVVTARGEGGSAPLGDLFARLSTWILGREGDPIREGEGVPHLTLRLRRTRALLHLVDAEGQVADEALRERRQRAARVLLQRASADAPSPLRRAVCASFARALDALVREELWELSDAWIAAVVHLAPADLDVVAEASMVPELEAMVRAYAEAARVGFEVRERAGDAQLGACLDAMLALAQAFPRSASPRVEALRNALLALTFALESVAEARSRAELPTGEESAVLGRLGEALESLARLVAGARRRLEPGVEIATPAAGRALHQVEVAVYRSLRGGEETLGDACETAASTIARELPSALADPAVALVRRIPELPVEGAGGPIPGGPVVVSARERPLAAWLPPGRILGGFYVLRPIGNGAGGSVFVACRVEERHDPRAERFALKVPEYDGTAARTLSEEQFLQMFREEAGALLSVPVHRNVARFVTFDAGARPKPILVMELVEGRTLETILEKDTLLVEDALAAIDGVAAGLATMHAAGVGHLDVKPANVIVRGGGDAVLVDFGLAGRKLRPGCGSPHYGAPEIWKEPDEHEPRPMATDVYAFSCLAWELLTGRLLFQGENLVEVIASQLLHDGWPTPLVELRREGGAVAAVAEVLAHGLRRDPQQRPSIADLRLALSRLAPALADHPWPLGDR
jgi:eukaryotic-like serine/threonine-protein kinase